MESAYLPKNQQLQFAPTLGSGSEVIAWMMRGGLPALLLVDLVFCILHVAHSLGYLQGELFSLNTDRGASEWWQYLQAAVVAATLATLALRSRQLVYAAWALVFAYALLDDSLMIHEAGGLLFARLVGFANAFGLRAEDYGELIVSALFGVPLILFCWWEHRRATPPARSHSRQLLWMFALLVFFGIFVDMAHIVIASAGVEIRGLNTLEDGGELLAMSLAAAFSLGLLRRSRAAG